MAIKTYKPTSPARRFYTTDSFDEVTKKTPEKSLLAEKKHNAGRNNQGRITVRHRGGGNRVKYRIIDIKRNKDGISLSSRALPTLISAVAPLMMVSPTLSPRGARMYLFSPSA